VQAYRQTPEIKAVVAWLQRLESDVLDSLVKCTKEQHDGHAAEVILLRYIMQAIVQPSFEEQQAKYKGAK
jgi:prephenate dehydrogenase